VKQLTLFVFLLLNCIGFAQNLPLDFESSSTYPFTNFDGGVATKIPNPIKTGINTSATVMQLVKGSGAVWAGSKITLATPIDFSTKRIFKVKVLSPVAGIKLLLKFEGAGPFFQKLSAPITAANVWEELTFDFSAEAVNNLNNQVVFMFDFGTVGNGGPNSTYLFDDVTQSAGTEPIKDLPVLPLTFESTSVAYPFADFGGAATSIIANPFRTGMNQSATVVKLIKNAGETYAGSVITMAGPINFSNNKIVKVKVWAPVAGKKLMLKFEGSTVDFDNGAFETDAVISKANEWVELTFDYNSPTLFPPVNNNDHKIVFFFDFGTKGDGSVNSTYYFDDIAFSTTPSAVSSYQLLGLNLFPNPAFNQLTVSAKSEISHVIVTNLLGQSVTNITVNGRDKVIDLSAISAGNYLVTVKMADGQLSTQKFVKL
jgi:hypothetical protein